MKIFLEILVIGLLINEIICPPVKEQKKDGEAEDDKNELGDELDDVMEYSRYLKEVVNALESDPSFREKLEKAEEADIRSGKIANELEFVSHRVRNRLDEIKRSEIERLRHLAMQKNELEKEHINHDNPHTFEIEDLQKLIKKTSHDLEVADRKRRNDFKTYEMQKEFEKNEKLKALNEAERKKLEEEYAEKEKKHKQHEKLHHPGTKQQLEEVWEKQDHMDPSDFDPKTFFMYHDLDGNDHWDPNEVKALFVKELDKMYQSGAPEDDMRERAEEMERMREHIFKEADLNQDGLISFQEFLQQTRKPEFTQDQGWESLDQQRVYTQEEYNEFERRRMEEVQQLIAQGMLPPHAAGMPPQQYPGQAPPQPYYPNQQPQYHPGQAPPQPQYHQPQAPPQQYHPGQAPPQQYHPGQAPPQQQYHPGAAPPQQQYHAGQAPSQQQHPGQVSPQQQYNGGQAPPQYNSGQASPQQYNSNQVPQQQYNAGQAPPQQYNHNQAPQQNNQGHAPPQQNQVPQQQPAASQQINNHSPPQHNEINNQPNIKQEIHSNDIPNHIDKEGKTGLDNNV